MQSSVSVTVHSSCFPGKSRAAFLESLRMRQMNHRFHYESDKQAQRWLALHEAYSPARTDDECQSMYQRAFVQTAGLVGSGVNLFSIGCGGGQKDMVLLKALAPREYIPSDVSLPLALHAHLSAREKGFHSMPLVLDLPNAPDLREFVPRDGRCLFAFFGMLPNFEPSETAPLWNAMRMDDYVIMSANLASGSDYAAGVQKILPLYENDLTRRWLATVLLDAGLQLSPSEIEFSIQAANQLLRVEANYTFQTSQKIVLDGEEFSFGAGEPFRLFFSYRHTPKLLREQLAPYGIEILREWIASSGEEGVFLGRKSI